MTNFIDNPQPLTIKHNVTNPVRRIPMYIKEAMTNHATSRIYFLHFRMGCSVRGSCHIDSHRLPPVHKCQQQTNAPSSSGTIPTIVWQTQDLFTRTQLPLPDNRVHVTSCFVQTSRPQTGETSSSEVKFPIVLPDCLWHSRPFPVIGNEPFRINTINLERNNFTKSDNASWGGSLGEQ